MKNIKDLADAIRIKEEKRFADFFLKSMNLSFINFVLNQQRRIHGEFTAFYLRMKGYGLQLTKEIDEKIYSVFSELITKLGFEEGQVECYLSNNAEFNAYSYYGYREIPI